MKATLLKTQEHKSKQGGVFYYFFFKGEDCKSYRSCIYPNYGNFSRWRPFVGKENIVLDNLVARGHMIDADSFPHEVKKSNDTELELATRRSNQYHEEQLNLGL